MPGLYRDEGVVLRTIKLGEADRIVTIMTQGHGKVRAVAKGVRKTMSRFGARLEPASRVALQCYKGRELDVVTQVETLESNRVLREEYGLLTHAVPMLEAVDQVAQDREAEPGAVPHARRRAADARRDAFTRSSRPRSSGSCCRSKASTRSSTAAPAASEPTSSSCRRVRSRGRRHDVRRACRGGGRPLSPSALDLLQRILGGGLNGVLGAIAGTPRRTRSRRSASGRSSITSNAECARPPSSNGPYHSNLRDSSVARRRSSTQVRKGWAGSLARHGQGRCNGPDCESREASRAGLSLI